MAKDKHEIIENVIYDGFAFLSEDRSIPFHFENGNLELFLGNSPFTFKEDTNIVIGQRRGMMAGGLILFHLSMPLDNHAVQKTIDEFGKPVNIPISMGNMNRQVNFYLDGYQENTLFTKMLFSFPELDHFIPSSAMCTLNHEESRVQFSRDPDIITKFSFEFKGRTVIFSLRLTSVTKISGIRSLAETKSEIRFEFDETGDMEFFQALHYLVQNIFSFVCNRQNIAIDSAVLMGRYQQNIRTEIKEIPAMSKFYVFNKYKEDPEESRVIVKTIRYDVLAPAFKNLFSLFLENKVSVQSIHASSAARRLFDLKHCLHITAAFEYYQRMFLSEISSTETIQVYDEVKVLIQSYVNDQIGEKKKKAKSILKSLRPNVSLQDKICKVYKGYNDWRGLDKILFEYYGDDVTELAKVANEWRNELAHEKREYEPVSDVITAVSLVEHLNYCIVLRLAGYSDDEIKAIVDSVLTRMERK